MKLRAVIKHGNSDILRGMVTSKHTEHPPQFLPFHLLTLIGVLFDIHSLHGICWYTSKI